MIKKEEHYIDNDEFLKLLIEYKNIVEEYFHDDIYDLDFSFGVKSLTFKNYMDKFINGLSKTLTNEEKEKIIKLELSNLQNKEIKRRKNKKLRMLLTTTKNNLVKTRMYNRLQNKLGNMFLSICRGLLTKPNYINYTWDRKDDMISEATYHMSRYVLMFDVEQTYPFSYFTSICDRAFKQCINKNNKYTNKFQPLVYIENMHLNDAFQEEDWG